MVAYCFASDFFLGVPTVNEIPPDVNNGFYIINYDKPIH